MIKTNLYLIDRVYFDINAMHFSGKLLIYLNAVRVQDGSPRGPVEVVQQLEADAGAGGGAGGGTPASQEQRIQGQHHTPAVPVYGTTKRFL